MSAIERNLGKKGNVQDVYATNEPLAVSECSTYSSKEVLCTSVNRGCCGIGIEDIPSSLWVLPAMVVLFFVVFFTPLSNVQAQLTLNVNSVADDSDVYPGDGVCNDGFGNCTLRAAVEEANAENGFHNIMLPAGTIGVEERIVVTGDMFLSGAGVSATTIDSLNGGTVFEIEGGSFSVSRLSFMNTGELTDCISLAPDAINSSLVVNEVTFNGFGGAGIVIDNASDGVSIKVSNTTFMNNLYAILYYGSEIRGSLALSNNSFWANENEGIFFTPAEAEFAGFSSKNLNTELFSQRSLIKSGAGSPNVTRLAAPDRYATAAVISANSFPDPMTNPVSKAYIATGENFPDALAGGSAAALAGGPILLVRQNSIPDATAEELKRLNPQEIVILGGPVAVSVTVEQELAGDFPTVTRLAGLDRYETAAAISVDTFSKPEDVSVVFIATGENFPDALAGVPAATRSNAPILLVRNNSIPVATENELNRLNPQEIVILGGPVAVSPQVEQDLDDAFPTVTRLAGLDRYETATEISEDTFSDPNNVSVLFIATGENFPDALAGGPAAGLSAALSGGPILLVRQNSIPDSTKDELTRLNPQNIIILGGEEAVSTNVESQLKSF